MHCSKPLPPMMPGIPCRLLTPPQACRKGLGFIFPRLVDRFVLVKVLSITGTAGLDQSGVLLSFLRERVGAKEPHAPHAFRPCNRLAHPAANIPKIHDLFVRKSKVQVSTVRNMGDNAKPTVALRRKGCYVLAWRAVCRHPSSTIFMASLSKYAFWILRLFAPKLCV